MMNFSGLLIIFIGFEFIPNKYLKCGTLFYSYFLYYGVVRMSLEPLRDERYKYVMTYVMTGI
jgi:phosphatidylglycerol:prolipoprotein diacylglycerol transferase